MSFEIRKINIKELQPNTGQIEGLPKNPRFIRDERFASIKKSITDKPDMLELREIFVFPHKDKFVTICGNMRLRACKDLGYKEMVAKVLPDDYPVEQLAELAIKDNISYGNDDADILANEWTAFDLEGWGMEFPEFEAVEEETETQDAEPQIDRAAELNEKWKVEFGDLWQIGEHKLLCGDSTKKSHVDYLMGGELINLVWTDPPYGVKYGEKMEDANPISHRVRTIVNDDLSDEQLEEFIRESFKNAANVSAKGCAIYVACPPGKQLPTLIRAFAGSCFEFRWQLVWVKDSLVLSRADYHFRHENILYGWKEGEAHYFTDDRTQDSVFEVARPKASIEHPTMKPIELIAQMIKNSSKPNQIIYDGFGGSGSTMIASENTNRKSRLIELTPNFCAVILERMQTAFPDIDIKRLEKTKTAD